MSNRPDDLCSLCETVFFFGMDIKDLIKIQEVSVELASNYTVFCSIEHVLLLECFKKYENEGCQCGKKIEVPKESNYSKGVKERMCDEYCGKCPKCELGFLIVDLTKKYGNIAMILKMVN